jgi:hypothetical protein
MVSRAAVVRSVLHSSGRLEPVFSRHSNVYDDDVWLKHRHCIETRLAITHGSHKKQLLTGNYAEQPIAFFSLQQ